MTLEQSPDRWERENGENCFKGRESKAWRWGMRWFHVSEDQQWGLWFWGRVSEGEGDNLEKRMTDYVGFCTPLRGMVSTGPSVITLLEPVKPQNHPLDLHYSGLKPPLFRQNILHENSRLSSELHEPSNHDRMTPWTVLRNACIYDYFKFLDPNHLSAYGNGTYLTI